MWHAFLDLLFPRTSLSGQSGAWVTPAEWAAMRTRPILLDRALLRDRGIVHLDRVAAAGQYDGSPLLKTAILTFKYRRIRALAVPLGELLQSAVPLLLAPSSALLCPVPLHWTRRFSRGFNQSLLLSNELSALCGWRTEELLCRVRSTGHQARRTRIARMSAMQQAFALVSDRASIPSTVILVDDVCTTGATLDACAAALKEAGVAHVFGLVVAFG